MVKLLRIVLLQDACALIGEFSESMIFQYPIFKSVLFQDFYRKYQESSVAELENPANHIQRSLPQVAQAIQNMNQYTNDTITTQSRLIRTDLAKIEVEFTQFVPRMEKIFAKTMADMQFTINMRSNSNVDHNNESNELEPSVVSDGEIQVVEGPSSNYSYKMSRTITTVQQLWKEYKVGISGQRSIESIEAEYGSRWRGGSKSSETKFFHGRLLVINCVKQLMIDQDESTAIDEVESRRVVVGSLHKLVGQIRVENSH